MRLIFSLILLLQVITAEFQRPEWPEADTPIDFKSNCINYDVRIYGFDFGYDQHVVNLAPGQSYHMKSHLGQVFFALSPQNIYLGNFTVHWDEKRPKVIGQGSGHHFVITCPDDYLYICPACDKQMILTPQIIQEHGFTTRSARGYDQMGNNRIDNNKHHNNLARVRMSKQQRLDVTKYTKMGFKAGMKFKDISPEGWKGIVDFWRENQGTHNEVKEPWDESNIYVNHWEAKTTIAHLPQRVKTIIWNDLSRALGDWAGVDGTKLVGSSIYGIRRYHNGSVLMNHLDRGDELVLSAIINVDQGKMDEPWPLQVYDHQLQPHIVFMEPGDCVFYESASIIHGRPFPLRGEYMANVFAHTKPHDWSYKMTGF